MAFLWPTKTKAEPGGVARLGRVLHWFFVLVAIACAIGGGVMWLTGSDPWTGLGVLGLGLLWGGGVFFFGRAVRYVLSGE